MDLSKLFLTTWIYYHPPQKEWVVGKLHTSPIPKIFLYLLCLKVSISTSNNPSEWGPANPDSTNISWGLQGMMEYKLW